MIDIIHRIGIKTPAEKVYKALTTLEGLGSWWTEEVSGETKTGGRIEFLFRSKTGELIGKMVMEVKELNDQ
ncbi:MAG TPA: SRPBCC domain-containing protein, partial [Leptospiraceae bacterium]|nr:SRPBCC domain-containing protein [Leptospiraceae bacterium]